MYERTKTIQVPCVAIFKYLIHVEFPETVFNPAEHFDLNILVFDISFRASFLAIEDCYTRLSQMGALFTVVGTKSDLDALRAIDVLPCKVDLII